MQIDVFMILLVSFKQPIGIGIVAVEFVYGLLGVRFLRLRLVNQVAEQHGIWRRLQIGVVY